jgi:hypothetical protein
VTASVKPSVMKLPVKDTAPLIMAGLGTGLAPFRAFVQYRAMQKAQGMEIGSILLYMGSRHQREEYLYGEEWEAYQDAGVITLLGRAFSRDQPQKIYIQDRMRQTVSDIIKAYIKEEGVFYLCGPTWPVPDVTEVLQEAIALDAKASNKKVDPRKEIERLKENLRYVLEVYWDFKVAFALLHRNPTILIYDSGKTIMVPIPDFLFYITSLNKFLLFSRYRLRCWGFAKFPQKDSNIEYYARYGDDYKQTHEAERKIGVGVIQ